ncbi:MAG TPA: type I methionyl aminopeptidase [Acidimicrobiales bacterium]|nr:type I methionyl aminopeptidase [Acidimicrobiales bacterium]
MTGRARSSAARSAPAPKANDPCWCGSGRKYKRCHRVARERVRPGIVSPRRHVPPHIARPDYADTGRPVKVTEPFVKPPATIEAMRHAGRVAAEVLHAVSRAVAPGVTTDELDALAHDECIRRGAYPSPLNYHGYPKSVCTSVNEVICHGIPDSRPLADGDIVNVDVTVFVGGVHGDTNATFAVGKIDPESARLIDVTRRCLELGIAAVRPGRPVSDIGRAIERHAEANGCGVVRAYVGHGIGEVFHNGLVIPHVYDPSATTVLEEGMTFTIEPMITLGSWRDVRWDDGWTAVTADGSRTAQFEHMLVVTAGGAEVLTEPPA